MRRSIERGRGVEKNWSRGGRDAEKEGKRRGFARKLLLQKDVAIDW